MFLSALAKKPSKMAMAGEDLDNACKQSAENVVLFFFVWLYTCTSSQSLHRLLKAFIDSMV